MTQRFTVASKAPRIHLVKADTGHKVIGRCGIEGWWKPASEVKAQRQAAAVDSLDAAGDAPSCVPCTLAAP